MENISEHAKELCRKQREIDTEITNLIREIIDNTEEKLFMLSEETSDNLTCYIPVYGDMGDIMHIDAIKMDKDEISIHDSEYEKNCGWYPIGETSMTKSALLEAMVKQA